MEAAASDTAIADIIDALAQVTVPDGTSTATDRLAEEIGKTLAGKVLAQLDGAVGNARRREFRLALADHFWCGLMAEFACTIDKVKENLDQVPGQVSEALMRSRGKEGRSFIGNTLIELAVQITWQEIQVVLQNLPPARHLADLTRAARVLAVLMCPAPEHHRAVIKCGAEPLTGDAISEATKQRLLEVLPHGWLAGDERARQPAWPVGEAVVLRMTLR
jgi:hypothetical protein